jgi:hypothetical protein
MEMKKIDSGMLRFHELNGQQLSTTAAGSIVKRNR